MREDAKGLYVEGRLALGTEKGREAYELMKMGWKAGMSIGFMPSDTEKADDGVREVRELDLWEVSIVTFPANAASMVEQVRAKIENGDEPTKRDIERLLTRDAGLSRSKTAALLAGGYDAMINQRDADDEVSKMWKALEGFSL
nr:putative HK97 prohead protease [Pseudo-nitzschia multiseries DNA virus]